MFGRLWAHLWAVELLPLLLPSLLRFVLRFVLQLLVAGMLRSFISEPGNFLRVTVLHARRGRLELHSGAGHLIFGSVWQWCARMLSRTIARKGVISERAKRCCVGRSGNLKGVMLSGWCVDGRFCDGPQTRIKRLYL